MSGFINAQSGLSGFINAQSGAIKPSVANASREQIITFLLAILNLGLSFNCRLSLENKKKTQNTCTYVPTSVAMVACHRTACGVCSSPFSRRKFTYHNFLSQFVNYYSDFERNLKHTEVQTKEPP